MHSLEDLERLAAAWRSRHPERAGGGLAALSGFSFQFLMVLNRAVDAWLLLDGNERQSPAPLAAELISDMAWLTPSELMVVCQVKRTATSRSVREALEDLWSVHQVAAESLPDLVPRLRYRLLFRAGSAETRKRAVDKWVADDPNVRRRFAERLSFEVPGDPEHDIVAKLSNEFGAAKPSAVVRRWTGDLIAATTATGGAAQQAAMNVAVERIWSDLRDLASAKGDVPFYVWSSRDHPPSEERMGDVLTGQPPELHHLREGFFAARQGVVVNLVQRFIAVARDARDSAAEDPRLPVFWIGGRSGSGKSVLLLQVLSQLHEHGWDPIFWLGRNSTDLPHTLRWARVNLDESAPPLVGLDDPYTPNNATAQREIWEQAVAEVERWKLADASQTRLPVVVCCGPSEQAALLRAEYGDAVRVHEATVDRVAPDIAELRDWFRARTGRPAPTFADDSNLLLVQLFAEWRTGETLAAFATRFRRRLQGLDETRQLLSFVTRMLALNRLYVGYPAAAEPAELSDAHRDALARLRAEEHIVAAHAEIGRTGLWLAHPHLANAIYEQWHSGEHDVYTRAGHFRDAASAALKFGATPSERTAPIRVLGLALAGAPTAAAGRVDRQFAAQLSVAYDESRERSGGTLPFSELAAWVKLRTVATVALTPDPVDEALTMLAPQALKQRGAGWTVQALLEGIDSLDETRRGDVVTLTLGLLRSEPRWVDWARTARLLLQNEQTGATTELCVEWLSKQWNVGAARWLLPSAVEALPGEPRLVALARRALDDQAAPGWGRIWSAWWATTSDPDERDELTARALRWLPDRWFNTSWAYVWIALWNGEVARKEICALGHQFLNAGYEHAGWSVVWTAIWDGEFASDDAASDGRIWRRRRHDHAGRGRRWLEITGLASQSPGFGYIWERLWTDAPGNKALEALGYSALWRTDTASPVWGRVYPALIEAGSNVQGALQLGRNWLRDARLEDPPWGWVFPALIRFTSSADDESVAGLKSEVVAAGRRYLDQASHAHPSWAYVYEALWPTHSQDESFRARGRAFLAEADPAHGGWGVLWALLWEQEPGDPWLSTTSREWLNAHRDHHAWGHVFTGLVDHEGIDHILWNEGMAWLREAPVDAPAWSYVFLALAKHATARPSGDEPSACDVGELLKVATDWLQARPDSDVWDLVLKHAWPLTDDSTHARLQDRAITWLSDHQDHNQWPSVWVLLWRDDPREELVAMAREWAANSGELHHARAIMPAALFEQTDSSRTDAELVRSAAKTTEWIKLSTDCRARIARGREDAVTADVVESLERGPPTADPAALVAWKNLWISAWRAVTDTGADGKFRDTLFELGVAWLARPDPRAGRSYVFLELWSDFPSDRLYAAGVRYLRAAEPLQVKWPVIWLKLWTHGKPEGKDALIQLGTDWLAASYPDALLRRDAKWPTVWQRLWNEGRSRTRAVERLGVRALEEHGEDAPLAGVWLSFWTVAEKPQTRERLRGLATGVLSRRHPASAWTEVATAIAEQ